jgi:uncharacterized GH25 family protein
MTSRPILGVVAFVAVVSLASAHDFWLQPDTFTPAVNKPAALSLHVGDRFVSEKELAHQKKATVSLKLFSAGDAIDLDAKDDDKPIVRFTPKKAGVYFVALERDAKLITLEAKKFNSYLEAEGLDDVLSDRKKAGESDKSGREWYRRFIKTYLRAGGKGDDVWKKRAGHKLEIVPLSDPTALKKTATFAVRVLFDDKPLSGAKVTAFSRAGDKVKDRWTRTTAKGEATFKLGESGVHLVRLVFMRRAKDDREADWHSWWAAMTFEVN